MDERIRAYDVNILLPKHRDQVNVLRELTTKVDTMMVSMAKMGTTFDLVMKFAGGGIVVWAIKQAVDVVHTFVK